MASPQRLRLFTVCYSSIETLSDYGHLSLSNILKNVWRRVSRQPKLFLENYPDLYLRILRIKRRGHWSAMWVLSDETEVVIEGYPRSANSFAVLAFESLQPRPLKMATHVHSPAQVIKACQMSVPTMVLIRDPVDVVTAYASWNMERHTEIGAASEPDEFIKSYLEYWIRFYKMILPFQDRFLTAKFEEVTGDFGAVMNSFNKKFATSYTTFVHSQEAVQAIFDREPDHLSPSAPRNAIKTELRQHVERQTKLVEQAREIYKLY